MTVIYYNPNDEQNAEPTVVQLNAEPLQSRYSNFYTSADTFLYIEPTYEVRNDGVPIWLDKLETIAFNETVSAAPIYGIGQPEFGFTNLGNIIVSGEISLRFIHEDYLLSAIQSALLLPNKHDNTQVADDLDIDNYLGVDLPPSAVNRQRFISSDTRHVRQEKRASEYANSISESRLLNLPYYFNFRLVFNNENQYHKDTNKTLVIKDVRILSSQIVSSVAATGSVNVKYNFLAKMVK
ncbi:MAG: hypothetical protein DRQ78_05000 [Epsilonproteobacteria bacterium]|nr:MAG: hypothetical protein DRQ78_05000 [Campylobacterota bacterium]